MLDKPITKREAVTISKMLESGLVWYKHYMCWVDERIMLESEPELWLLELATTKHTQTAIGFINTFAYSEPFESFNSEYCNDEYVACMWLRYDRKEISWATFLRESGDYTDGNYSRQDCEFFYYMLNDFEDADFSNSIEKKQSEEVLNEFKDVIKSVANKYNEFIPYLKKYRETYGA